MTGKGGFGWRRFATLARIFFLGFKDVRLPEGVNGKSLDIGIPLW
jgi:hypothetical protein